MSHKTKGKDKISPLFDGLYKKNTVLISGLVIAPVVIGATTFINSLSIAFTFSLLTFFTLLVSSFIPRNLVYTIRIILYTLIASLVYVPVIIANIKIFGETSPDLKIILPLMIMNALIVSKSEMRFFRRQKGKMVLDVVSYILGFDVVIILVGFIREAFGSGTVATRLVDIRLNIPVLEYACGGFILVGLLAALLRKIQFIAAARKKD